MLKDKLSHIAVDEKLLQELQEAANKISVFTGTGIEEVEDGILSLLIPSKHGSFSKIPLEEIKAAPPSFTHLGIQNKSK